MTLASVPRYEPDRTRRVGDHAVVIGASVAGLCAARVLADAFNRVTVVERDLIPDDPATRPGVPHDPQIHALLEAGRATLEDLFAGYGEELVAAGGLMIDCASDVRFYDEGNYLADGPTRLPMYSATRPLFEHVARRHVAGLDGVTIRSGCRFVAYLADGDPPAVTGVRVVDRATGDEDLSADLVVDATGRASRTPNWLAAHGYAAPPVDEVRIDLGYATVAVDRPAGDRRAIFAPASPPDTRGGAAFPVEGGRWLVNVHGVHGDHPPSDLAGVERFARDLSNPDLGRLLAERSLVSDRVAFYPFPSNRRRYYERLGRFPRGLVVVGDAVASFNPIYGQGISVAALEALVLHHALASGGVVDLPRRFFARASEVVDVAWLMAVGSDAQFPATAGPTPAGAELFGRYVSRLTRSAHSDGYLREALFGVIMMQRPPSSLLRPGVVGRVVGSGLAGTLLEH